MKYRFFQIFLLAAFALTAPCCISCTEVETDEESGKSEKPSTPASEPIVLEEGVYTFAVSPLKGKWEVGDKIYVHGSYGPAAQMITLKAEDISEDGSVASVTLGEVTKYPVKPDGLYAAWPGELVVSGDVLTDVTTTFSSSNTLLCAAYLQEKNFAFKDMSAGLSFSAPGYDGFSFAGNMRPGLRYGESMLEHSSYRSSFDSRTNVGYPFIDGTFGTDGAVIWVPGSDFLHKGFTVYLQKDGNWSQCYVDDTDVTLTQGNLIELGDISSKLQPYEGLAPKMPEMGKRTQYEVKLNELSSICLSEDGTFIWGVGDGGDLAKISFTGEVSDKKHIGGDLEAVDINPSTHDLIMGGEPGYIYKVAYPSFSKREEFFRIPEPFKYSDTNAGVEGMTYYKDGIIYAGTQTNSDFFVYKLDTGERLDYRHLRNEFPVITEIADLCYDPLTDWLWIIDSEAHKFFVLTGDAKTFLGYYTCKGIPNPESICVDHERSCIWIAADCDSPSYLYKFDFTGLDDAKL